MTIMRFRDDSGIRAVLVNFACHPVTGWGIRNVSENMVSLPFEVLPEIGLAMKAQFPNSVLVSCANGYHGYLPLEHEFKRGGYEVSIPAMHFESDTGDQVLKAILKKLGAF